jgi:hypothetical protein
LQFHIVVARGSSMAAKVETGMEKNEMKLELGKGTPEKPVNCAFGGHPDQKTFAVLMVDKVKGSKAVLKDLVTKFKDASSPRYGVAFVDVEDTKLVKFRINTTVSGAAKKLVKTLKGTSFKKVEILLDDGTVVDSHTEEDEEEGVEAQDSEDPEKQPTTETSENEPEPVTATTGGAPPRPPAQPQQKPEFDKAALTQEWNELVKRLPEAIGKAPLLKEQLGKYATDAQINLKTNNLAYAKVGIDQLRRALDAVKAGATGAGKETLEKSSKLWHATRDKLQSEIEKLRGEILTTYEKSGMADQLDAAYQNRVSAVFDMLDDSLSDKLDAAAKLIDPAPRAQLVAEAKTMIQNHKTFVASDETITELDANPFVPLQLRATATGMLAALEKAVA